MIANKGDRFQVSDYIQFFSSVVTAKVAQVATFFAVVTVLAWLKSGAPALQWDSSLRRSGGVNLGLVLFNCALLGVVASASAALLMLLQSIPHLPHLPHAFWQDTPWLVRAFAALFILDFTNYWLHRFAHANAWLWPLHAVHHSDTDMHFLSSHRAHILEWLVMTPLVVAAAYLCGLSVDGVVFLTLVREFHQFYVHSKLDWSHGPLRHVIADPRFHRWHHVDRPEAHNKNFALFFPFLDLAFGTYYVPGPAIAQPTGFEGNPGDDFLKLLAFPFRAWAGMVREGLARAKSPDAPHAPS